MLLTLGGALFIGMTLGLLGSGGSILTLPILVYLLHHPEKSAIVESLAIVGMIALAGAIPYAWRGQVHWRTLLFFGVAGILGAYAGACFSTYLSGSIQLALFSICMVIAAWMMIKDIQMVSLGRQPIWLLCIEGFLLGSLTGCIGIGGGFLIVPALVLLVSLPMHLAVGTSLFIISLNALTAFIRHFINLNSEALQLDWEVIFWFIILGIAGSVLGSILSNHIPQKLLKKAFGYTMLPVGCFTLIHQISSP